jgi:hypothetical protein
VHVGVSLPKYASQDLNRVSKFSSTIPCSRPIFHSIEPIAFLKSDRAQPEFGDFLIAFYVNVGCFNTVARVERYLYGPLRKTVGMSMASYKGKS